MKARIAHKKKLGSHDCHICRPLALHAEIIIIIIIIIYSFELTRLLSR